MSRLESDIQAEILGWLKARNVLVWRMSMGGVKHVGFRARNSMKGWPDLFGIIPNSPGKMFCVEVKSETKLSREQTEMLAKLEAAGCLVIVAKCLEDVTYFMDSHLR